MHETMGEIKKAQERNKKYVSTVFVYYFFILAFFLDLSCSFRHIFMHCNAFSWFSFILPFFFRSLTSI